MNDNGRVPWQSGDASPLRHEAEVNGPLHVFILSWERPVYLWACLDALFRLTRTPRRFVLIDNGSRDPLVHRVIEGFERRDMFHAVHLLPRNAPENLGGVIQQYRPHLGRYLGYVESDTVITEPAFGCWLGELSALMDKDDKLAMLGSYIDTRDFVAPEVARKLHPGLDDATIAGLVKAKSPERRLSNEPPPEPVIAPFNPPGRLLLLRWEALAATGLLSDSALHQRLTALGWRTGISTRVRHRHLSLLHAFDYPDFDVAARSDWVQAFDKNACMVAATSVTAPEKP